MSRQCTTHHACDCILAKIDSYEREIKALREALRLKQAKAHHHKSAEQIGLANKEADYRKSLENEVENEFRCSREKG